MAEDALEVLKETKALIDAPERWVRGLFYDRHTRPGTICRCLVGAICTAVTGDELSMATENPQVVRLVANYFDGVTPEALSEWNDNPKRKYDEVMTRLSRAIALAEQEAA